MKQGFDLGRYGEDIALSYLLSIGYKLVGRNISNKLGEVDLLCIDSSKILIFVEVKTMRQDNPATRLPDGQVAGLLPEDNVTSKKLSRMKRFAQKYVSLNPESVGDPGFRIDVVSVSISAGKDPVIRHYENV